MALSVRLDLANRYAQAFGLFQAYALPGLPGFYGNIETYEPDQARRMSKMGTPIFDELILRDPDDNSEYRFVLPPMLKCGQTKRRTVTPITGGEGDIIEDFGNDSWAINIKGLLVNMDEKLQYPGDQVELLNVWLQKHKALNVESQVLENLNITQLYFRGIPSIEPLEGFRDTVKFNLNAYSYEPVDFYIKDDN